MSARYLLDTSVLSELVRDPRGAVAERLQAEGDANVFTSVVVACELRFGARKRDSATLSARVEDLLASIAVVALEPGVDRHYGEVRDALERRGLPIGANDLLIAAHALQQDAILVTNNVAEFRRVPGLRVESWRRGS